MLDLSNTHVIKDVLCSQLGDDVEEMSFPHGVQVGEDGVLDPKTPAVAALWDITKVCTGFICIKALCVCVSERVCVCVCVRD